MKLIIFLLSSILITFSLVGCHKNNLVKSKLDIAIWYWNSQITLEQSDLDSLRNIGVNTIYFHAGQFQYDNGNISMIQVVDKWPPVNGFRIGVVFNFTPEMIRAFVGLSDEQLATTISSSIEQTIAKAESAQIKVVAVQCDFDVPTSQLKRYGLLLQQIRKSIGSRELSITTLVDWIHHKDYEKLLESIDLHFPQLYGLSITQSFNTLRPITSASLIAIELKNLANSSKPYYIGLPTYGYALVFDQKDKLLSVRTDLNLAEFSHNPDLKLLETRFANKKGENTLSNDDYVGENFYIFVATANIPLGKIFLKEGDKVVFDRLTPSSLAKTLAVVGRQKQNNLQGICLFRYPQINESMVLSVPEIIALWHDKPLNPEITINYKVKQNKQIKEIEISLENNTMVESLCQTDSVELVIQVTNCQLIDIKSTNFQSIETFVDNSPSSLRVANKIKLSAIYIGRQQKLIAHLELSATSKQSSMQIGSQIKPSNLAQSLITSKLEPIIFSKLE